MCLGRVIGEFNAGEAGVIGWKSWRMEKEPVEGAILRSATRRSWWPDARKEAGGRVVPEIADGPGIYAWSDARRSRFGRPEEVVTGVVSLGGLIVLHERGFRAEHATILSLELRSCGWHGDRAGYCACTHGPHLPAAELARVRAQLEHRYGCTVRLVDTVRNAGGRITRMPRQRHAPVAHLAERSVSGAARGSTFPGRHVQIDMLAGRPASIHTAPAVGTAVALADRS